MIKIHNNQIYSTKGKYVHRLDTETYFKKSSALLTDTVDMFEEVDELPKYSKELYNLKVRELIKTRYTIEDEIALYRQKDIKPTEFDEYYQFCEECKVKAKEELSNG